MENTVPTIQIIMIKQALIAQGHGMMLSRRLPAGTTMARKILGLKGNRESLLRQVTAILDGMAIAEVENGLHAAGIIEDPDVDGGIMG